MGWEPFFRLNILKEIEIQVHLAGQGQPKAIKIAEDDFHSQQTERRDGDIQLSRCRPD